MADQDSLMAHSMTPVHVGSPHVGSSKKRWSAANLLSLFQTNPSPIPVRSPGASILYPPTPTRMLSPPDSPPQVDAGADNICDTIVVAMPPRKLSAATTDMGSGRRKSALKSEAATLRENSASSQSSAVHLRVSANVLQMDHLVDRVAYRILRQNLLHDQSGPSLALQRLLRNDSYPISKCAPGRLLESRLATPLAIESDTTLPP